MILIKATENHIQELVAISKAAFDSDITVGGTGDGGPPEYDSVEWHIEMMQQGHLFTAIVEDTIVGAPFCLAMIMHHPLCILAESLYLLSFSDGDMGLN